MSLPRRLPGSPLWPMPWKELVQLRRHRLTLAMMLGIPAIQLVLFGYASQTEVRHLPHGRAGREPASQRSAAEHRHLRRDRGRSPSDYTCALGFFAVALVVFSVNRLRKTID